MFLSILSLYELRPPPSTSLPNVPSVENGGCASPPQLGAHQLPQQPIQRQAGNLIRVGQVEVEALDLGQQPVYRAH